MAGVCGCDVSSDVSALVRMCYVSCVAGAICGFCELVHASRLPTSDCATCGGGASTKGLVVGVLHPGNI